jgi:ABC-2 type transport system permease protein
VSTYLAAAQRPSGSALRRLAVTEARLLLREPITLFWGLAFPMAMLAVMGIAGASPKADVGGLKLVAVYEPIVMAFISTAFAVQALPVAMAGYRERGVLRRLATTPVGPVRVLAAQLAVNFVVALTATVGVLVVGRLGFGVALPRQVIGFVATLLLADAAMLALGLLAAALAPSGRAAGGIGAILFFPLMFFAGLWTPQATMSPILRHISHFTPLGAAVPGLQDTMGGHWPPASTLPVLAGYAVVLGVAAIRFFRWDSAN